MNPGARTYAWTVAAVSGGAWWLAVATGASFDEPLVKGLLLLGLLGPPLGAGIALWRHHGAAGRIDFARRLIDARRITLAAWLVIAGLPAALAMTGAWLTGTPSIPALPYRGPWALASLALVVLLAGPLPEEIGWRGYWLDALRTRHGALAASVIIGLAWALWHVPLFLVSGYPLQAMAGEPLALGAYFGDLVPKSIVFTWVYFECRRSILAAVLLHFSINLVGTTLDAGAAAGIAQTMLWWLAAAACVGLARPLFLASARR